MTEFDNVVVSMAFGIWRFDAETGNWNEIIGSHDCREDYPKNKDGGPLALYGFSWDENQVYAISGRHLLVMDGKVLRPKPLPEVLAYTHQMCFANDRLNIACNGEDKIISINPGDFSDIQMSNSLAKDGGAHVNSVFYDAQDKGVYACAHNKGRPSFIVRLDKDLKFVDRYEDLESFQIHNVYREDRYLYYLHSPGEEFVVYDLDARKVVHKLNVGERIPAEQKKYLRGLARDASGFFIGAAFHAGQDERNDKRCKLAHINNSLDFANVIDLPNGGQIREVRLAKGDLAHNGITFPI